MGYTTYVTGAIVFDSPIPWGAVKDDPYLKGWPDSTKCVQLCVATETVETDEGTLTRRCATAIIPISSDRFKAYNIEAEVQELVDRYCSPNGRECHGRLDGEGEESGDLWRLYVRDGRVVKDVPRIVWPDGEVQQGRA